MSKQRFFRDERSALDRSGWVRWINSADEAVPAYGVVRLKEYNELTKTFVAEKPTGEDGVHVANGGVPVAPNQYGASHLYFLSQVTKTEAEFLVGQEVGPVVDSWEMSVDGSGYMVLAPLSAQLASIVNFGGSGEGKCQRIWFTVDSADCAARTLEVEVFAWTEGCDFENVYGTEYGLVTVHDILCVMTPLTEGEIEGTGGTPVKGSATLGYREENGYCYREWFLDALCAQPECAV